VGEGTFYRAALMTQKKETISFFKGFELLIHMTALTILVHIFQLH
jgi:hypothetical protein